MSKVQSLFALRWKFLCLTKMKVETLFRAVSSTP